MAETFRSKLSGSEMASVTDSGLSPGFLANKRIISASSALGHCGSCQVGAIGRLFGRSQTEALPSELDLYTVQK